MSKRTTLRTLFFVVILIVIIFIIRWFMSNVDSGYLPRLFQRLF